MNDYIINIDVEKLQPHPINSEIYSHNETQHEELMKSIELNGLLEPLVIDNQNTIVSGHRRYQAIKDLGWDTCNCRLSYFENMKIALVEMNRYRKKTNKEILKEAEILTEEYKTQIKRGSPKKNEKRTSKNWSILNVSDKLGVSTTRLKQLKSIQTYEPKLLDDIDLGKISIYKAYHKVREEHILKNDEPKYYDKHKFKITLKRLLDTYNPATEDIFDVLNSHPKYNSSFSLKS